jgi:uncharacterized membrane protein
MTTTRTALLFLATICSGYAAGLFTTYASTVMPGLTSTDDKTFVGAFQALDRAVVNWFTMLILFGTPLLVVASIAVDRSSPVVWWLVAALVLMIATILMTGGINVPLNDAIKAAGDPNEIDVAQVRADFREGWWQAWNWVRVGTTGATFACLAWALVLLGRATG